MRLALLLLALPAAATAGDGRVLAVTVDDLPASGAAHRGTAELEGLTRDLLAQLRAAGAPAVGFVNEQGLDGPGGAPEPARVALLRAWLEAGHELGNHGRAHLDLHRVAVEDWLEDVRRGDEVTRPLARAAGRPYRWFRHPYLHTGRSAEVRRRAEAALAAEGLAVAPVTHDNSEWIYARAYERSLAAGEAALAARIGEDYVRYMVEKAAYFDRNARDLFGRPVAQVLLVHANRLNADRLAALAAALRAAGWSFVTLEEALRDPAYRSPDTYHGPAGLTWLHRWALTRGVPKAFFAGEPATPGFVLEAAGVDSE